MWVTGRCKALLSFEGTGQRSDEGLTLGDTYLYGRTLLMESKQAT